MDKQKVKEIKKALECCSNREIYDCTSCPYRNVSSDCQENLIYDMGVYINELESENAYKQEHIELWFRKNEEKKKRIAELEKEKAEQLKHFAERLKGKLFDLGNIVNENDIDETLKEFTDGKV